MPAGETPALPAGGTPAPRRAVHGKRERGTFVNAGSLEVPSPGRPDWKAMSSYTRRNFIKRTVAVAGTLGLVTGCRRLQVTDRNEISRGAIDRLRAKLRGRLIVPSDPSSDSARRVFYWNAGTERRPRIIVQCAHEEDALRALEFARRHDLEVAARAGGHSHLGWGCSNGVVIDFSGMKRIVIGSQTI